jgi:F-type H+-transporting ATPase subunit b
MSEFFAFFALLKCWERRAHAIRHELDEARRLRDEAKSLLNDYRRKKPPGEERGKTIIEQAESEAFAAAREPV